MGVYKSIVDRLLRKEGKDKKKSSVFLDSLSLRWACFSSELWYKYRRNICCAHGYHKLETIHSGFESPKEKIKTGIEYQRCWVCDTLFFETKEERDVYKCIRKHDMKSLKRLLS